RPAARAAPGAGARVGRVGRVHAVRGAVLPGGRAVRGLRAAGRVPRAHLPGGARPAALPRARDLRGAGAAARGRGPARRGPEEGRRAGALVSVVVLGYHEMGCTGLRALLRHGVPVSAGFTYRDDRG